MVCIVQHYMKVSPPPEFYGDTPRLDDAPEGGFFYRRGTEMARKRPAFQFYASDWLGSTKHAMMSPAQRGAYIDLLCHQWNDPDCTIPDDDDVLAVLSGLGEGWLNGGCELLRQCFPVASNRPGRLANLRLLEVRATADEWSRKSREGGKRSGEVRRANAERAKGCDDVRTQTGNEQTAKGGSTKGGTNREPKGKPPSPSPSSSPSESSASNPSPTSNTKGLASAKPSSGKPDRSASTYSAEFLEWWEAYPRPVGKGKAWKAYQAAVKQIRAEHNISSAEAHDRLLRAAEAFATTPKGKAGKYCPHPSTWLSEARYDDDPATWQDGGSFDPDGLTEMQRRGVANSKLWLAENEQKGAG